MSSTVSVGGTLTVAVTADGGCPLPTVRNETPSIIQLDSVAPTTFRVTGKAVGTGQIRVRSAVDTLVTQLLSVTVVAP